jgi:hypothetical protein
MTFGNILEPSHCPFKRTEKEHRRENSLTNSNEPPIAKNISSPNVSFHLYSPLSIAPVTHPYDPSMILDRLIDQETKQSQSREGDEFEILLRHHARPLAPYIPITSS